jgi:O-acetyl-ADP-ribose deacetylase (regulator of RNase III)
LKIINGDIVKELKSGILAHNVNCSGVFNKGLAKQIRDTYPIAYKLYETEKVGSEMLGHVQFIDIGEIIKGKPPLIIANCWCQVYYGYKQPFGNAKQHFNYESWAQCLRKLIHHAINHDTTIHIPYMIGCGLAGGSIEEVIKLTERIQSEMNFKNLYAWKIHER